MDAQNTVKAQRQQRANRILARLREVIPSVLTRYPVDAAYVYGSVARGTVMPFSDLDIALLLSPPLPPPYERLKLELTLQGDIEDACGFYPVDVRAINQAPLMVQGQIIQQGVLLYERDRARRILFEVATRKRYFDFAPVARRLQEVFLKRVHKEGLLYGQSRNPDLDSQ